MIIQKENVRDEVFRNERSAVPFAYLSPIGNYAYIPILKNAHSFTKQLLEKLNWKPIQDYTYNFENKKIIVAYRDPMSRWISGLTEYLHMKHFPHAELTEDVVNILSQVVVVDGHTLPQCNYLHNINTDNCMFFIVNKNYSKNLSDLLFEIHGKRIDYSSFWLNSLDDLQTKVLIRNKLKKYINTNFYRFYYKNDIELYNYILENMNERTYR